MPQNVLITGASSGFGEALVNAFADAGATVTATMRNLDKAPSSYAEREGVLVQYLDVTDEESVSAAVAAAEAAFGPIDVLVNAAGYTQVGSAEELTLDEIRKLFDANFFGLVSTMKAVLPGMRQRGRGHIINFSSLAGVVGLPIVSAYSATKWAVEGYTEALSRDLAHLGVTFTIVEPGMFATNLGASASRPANPIDAYYSPDAAINRPWYDPAVGDLAKAAEAIVSVSGTENPPLRLYVGHALDDARRYATDRLDEWDRWRHLTDTTL